MSQSTASTPRGAGATTGPYPDLEALADTLWSERHVVEYLLFKLVTAKLLLAAQERRFVATALDEVERIIETLRSAEVQRGSALEAVAADWGTDAEELTLAELAARAPAPMDAVFRDHQEAFARLASEIEETANTNRQLASAALGEVRATIAALAGPTGASTYTAAGRHHSDSVAGPVRLDEVL
ncbi:flagellar protein FlgN [Egibacter rhizosphaerae]|uniref:Flagellar protein FlgN n=1 Tax=Egibacter rhizosphaerae TaxID=1670831 RepID=A0A411YCK4_9ACTN|nr:flagellar protein FlgN [Egibacter rhizosphaerae]QBI18930.1 flagellar protein FlgN [Egibacter rhizosphaerae]